MSITAEEIKAAAAEIVKQEITRERLGGDDRGWNRWKANNTSFFDYRTRLKVAELSGVNADITATAASIEHSAPRGLRKLANGLLITPDGTVVTKAKAQRLGYEVGQ